MAGSKRSALVTIGEEEFSVQSSPNESSSLVRELKEELLGHVNLQNLCSKLGQIGKLVHLAYFAAKGSGYGPGSVDMKMSIYELGTDVTKLGSLSSSTMSSFKASSHGVIQELKAAVAYLLDGFEEEAAECLESLTETAIQMAEEANSLKQKFEEKDKAVIATIRILEEAENERGVNQEKVRKQQKELNNQIEQCRKEKGKLKKSMKDAKTKKEHYQQKRDEGIENYEEPSLIKAFLLKIKGTPDPRKTEIGEWKELATQFYEIEKKQKELYNEQLKIELAFLSALNKCEDIEGDIGAAIKCLQEASNALQHIVSVMSNAAEFWDTLIKECSNLSDTNIKKRITKLCSADEEKRLQMWHSEGFKMQAVQYCGKWVALYSICGDYIENARHIQAELRSYNTINPSVEEARKTIPVLLQQLQEDTKQLIHENEGHFLAARSKTWNKL